VPAVLNSFELLIRPVSPALPGTLSFLPDERNSIFLLGACCCKNSPLISHWPGKAFYRRTPNGAEKDATGHGLWHRHRHRHRRGPGNSAAVLQTLPVLARPSTVLFVYLLAMGIHTAHILRRPMGGQSVGHIAQIALAIVLRFHVYCK